MCFINWVECVLMSKGELITSIVLVGAWLIWFQHNKWVMEGVRFDVEDVSFQMNQYLTNFHERLETLCYALPMLETWLSSVDKKLLLLGVLSLT